MNITITRNAAALEITKDSETRIIESSDIRTQVALQSENVDAGITIHSNPENAFDDVEIALEYGANIASGPDYLCADCKAHELAFFRLNNARNLIELDAAAKQVACYYLSRVPSQIPSQLEAEKDMAKKIHDRTIDNGSTPLLGVIDMFRNMLSAERQRAHNMVKINPNNPNVNFFTGSNEEINEVIKQGGPVLINSWLGSGKSKENLFTAFESACQRNASPLLIAPRRSQIAPMKNDPRHYTNAGRSGFDAAGVIGVVNSTIGLPAFEQHRNNTSMVLGDELELLLSHCASDAIGIFGKLSERGAATAGFYELVKKAAKEGTAVLADGLMSDYTATKIAETLGMKVTVATKSQGEFAHKINLHPTKAAMIATAQASLRAGKNVLVISDESHNSKNDKLEGTFNTLQKSATGESMLLDGAVFGDSEKAEFVSNLAENLSGYQLIVASPVVSSGVSIETDHFDEVFVLAAGTVLPTEVIQSTSRVRNLSETHLAFATKNRNRIDDIGYVFSNMAAREFGDGDDYNQENLDKLWAMPGVQDVVKRIAYENRMRRNYNNQTLMMMEALGFTISHVSADKVAEDKAKEEIKEGNDEAENKRIEQILNADDISIQDAQNHRKSEQMTREHEYQVEKCELREFYKTNQIDVELVKADKGGRQRKQITNLRLGVESAARNLSAFDANRRKVIKKLMKTLEIDLSEIMRGESAIITRVQAQRFAEWVQNKRSVVTVGGKSTKASEAYSQAFGDRRFNSKQAQRCINSVLHEEMGLSVKEHNKDSRKVSASADRCIYFNLHMTGIARPNHKLTEEEEAARDMASGYYDPTTGSEILKWFEQTRGVGSVNQGSTWETGMAFEELMESLKSEQDCQSRLMEARASNQNKSGDQSIRSWISELASAAGVQVMDFEAEEARIANEQSKQEKRENMAQASPARTVEALDWSGANREYYRQLERADTQESARRKRKVKAKYRRRDMLTA